MRKRTVHIVLIVMILSLIAGGIVFLKVFKKADTSVGDKPADVKIEATALAAEYEADENAANKKYLGKVIEVTGTITDITYDDNQNLIVVMTDEMAMTGVSCTFDNTQTDIKDKLKKGQTVTIKGSCTGVLMEVILTKCALVE